MVSRGEDWCSPQGRVWKRWDGIPGRGSSGCKGTEIRKAYIWGSAPVVDGPQVWNSVSGAPLRTCFGVWIVSISDQLARRIYELGRDVIGLVV